MSPDIDRWVTATSSLLSGKQKTKAAGEEGLVIKCQVIRLCSVLIFASKQVKTGTRNYQYFCNVRRGGFMVPTDEIAVILSYFISVMWWNELHAFNEK